MSCTVSHGIARHNCKSWVAYTQGHICETFLSAEYILWKFPDKTQMRALSAIMAWCKRHAILEQCCWTVPAQVILSWASCQIRKIAGRACGGNAGNDSLPRGLMIITHSRRQRGVIVCYRWEYSWKILTASTSTYIYIYINKYIFIYIKTDLSNWILISPYWCMHTIAG